MLSCAGLCNNAGFAHADREQDLPDAIVDLVRAGVVQLIALKPDSCAFPLGCVFADMVGQSFGEIERGRAPDIVL